MKMRIKGNSIRLRLTKTEIKRIENGHPVEEVLAFGGGKALKYQLHPFGERLRHASRIRRRRSPPPFAAF